MVSPLLLDRFRSDLAKLGAAPSAAMPLGVAVSGGPDSLALLLLAHAAYPGAVAAATVDHGLRAEAAEEARGVAWLCARLDVPHVTLTGSLPEGSSAQARARELRYRLLGQWTGQAGIAWLATAHHLDDQAETFLMRAARGAGVGGLAGVRPCTGMAVLPMPLLRPLLGWRKAELADIVASAGIAAADDPSNRSPAHDRTAFRALLAATPALEPARLARAAANLAEAEAALGWAVEHLAGDRLREKGGVVQLVDPGSLPRELRRRLVWTAIGRIAGGRPLRGDAVDRLLRLLESGRVGTLADVRAQPGSDWLFAPAPPRRG